MSDPIHPQNFGESNTKEVQHVTYLGLLANILLSALKYTLGTLGNSQALIADAIHSLSDCVTDIVVVIGATFWNKPADVDHPYGHRRYETLVTIFIGLSVGAVGVFLTIDAIQAISEANYLVPDIWVSLGAIASIAVKEILYRWTKMKGVQIKSTALIANAWHHRSDAISSIPVLIAIIGAALFPQWAFIDTIGAIVVSGFIIKAAIEIVLPGVRELVDQGAPEDIYFEILKVAVETEGVVSVHDLRTRYVSSSLRVAIHIVVDPEITIRQGHDIADKVTQNIQDFNEDVISVNVHLDPDDDRMTNLPVMENA
ncbi:MAG: cation transporter [Planctomycetes bacterium]|nr:cation transporter [Planctomycetota bacterium]